MVPHAAPWSCFRNPRRRRHGAWNGSAAVVEFSGSADAGDGSGPDPHAAGNHATRDRCAAPPRPRVLGDAVMNPQNYTFMFFGFTVAWLIVIGYVISIALREKKLRQELDRVKRMVEEGESTRR